MKNQSTIKERLVKSFNDALQRTQGELRDYGTYTKIYLTSYAFSLVAEEPQMRSKDTHMALAAGLKCPNLVKKLLKVGANPNADEGRAMIEAACSGDTASLRLMAAHGGNLALQNHRVLLAALENRQFETARALCEEMGQFAAFHDPGFTLRLSSFVVSDDEEGCQIYDFVQQLRSKIIDVSKPKALN